MIEPLKVTPNFEGRSYQRIFFIILVGLSVLGLFHSFRKEAFLLNRFTGRPRIDDRYVELKKILPPNRRLGYVSDAEPGSLPDVESYCKTQYSLIPRLVVTNENTRYVVANFLQPARAGEVCLEHSLTPIQVFNNGVALLERQKKP